MSRYDNIRVAFIGAGNMALAMTKGFIKNGLDSDKIWAVAPSERRLVNFKLLGCHITHNPEKLFQHSNADSKTEFYIFLCTKPKIPFETKGFCDFFESSVFCNSTSKGSTYHLISVMVGINLKKLESAFREKFSQPFYISRTMPNLGVEVNASPMVTTFSSEMPEEHKEALKALLSNLGTVFDVSEAMLDASVGISGSGLGFYCSFLQALADGAVADGLPREEALKMGAQTAIAMGTLILKGKHPIELRDSICSPGGSTIAGVQMLEEGNFSSLVMNTVKVTSNRGRAIAAKLNES